MAALTPVQRARSTLADALPREDLNRLPQGYERLGDVLILDLPLPGDEATVAQAYARVLGSRTVLGREGGIHGELRRPSHRLLWGDADTRTLHQENGLRFRLDAARIMWSAGNRAERERVARWDCRGETVVDCFAGVGYFAVPIAKRTGAQRVLAIEKNPESAAFLRENASLNEVDDRLEVLEGDCREVLPLGVADRVLLGYLPDSLAFVPTGLRALRDRGRLHVHRVVRAGMGAEGAVKETVSAAEREGAKVHGVRLHRVKSYGPRSEHVVVELEVDVRAS